MITNDQRLIDDLERNIVENMLARSQLQSAYEQIHDIMVWNSADSLQLRELISKRIHGLHAVIIGDLSHVRQLRAKK